MLKRFLSILLLGCLATSASAVEDIFVTDTMKSLPDDIALHDLYLKALCFKKQGRADSAMVYLNKYVEKDTTNGAVYMDIANMYISLGNSKESLANMQKAARLEPNNYWILRSEALLLLQNGKTNEGLKVYEDLVNANPDKVDDMASLATLYTRVGKKTEALSAWNKYENQVGISDQVSVSKFQLLYAMGEKKQAEAVLDSLIATDPTIPQFYITKASAYSDAGDYKKAEKVLLGAQKKFPNSGAIDQSLTFVYLNSGQEKKTVKYIKKMLASSDLPFETKRSLLLATVADSSMARFFGDSDFQSLIKQYPQNDQAYLVYSDYLLSKQNTKGIDYLKKATEVNPQNEYAWVSLLTYYETVDKDAYKKTLDEAYKSLPESGQLLFYKGTAAMADGDRTAALGYWRKSADILTKDPNEKPRCSVVYGVIGDVCMEGKDTLGAFSAYESALMYNSGNIDVLNNYAYFLSEMNKDLEKAEQMSGKAIAAEPTNITFLDTYAWVLYKMGRYSTARLYQEQAVMLGGDKLAEVMEHYGDILYKNDDKTAALSAWQSAAKLLVNPSDRLKKKVETGTLVE